MASITSIISIFVLLLATYCHSAPIGTEFQFSTVENELTSVTPKPIIVAIEFNTVPNEHAKRSEGHSVQKFTTERSILEGHNSNKRSEGHSVEKFTTERSILEGHNSNKRTLLDEFTTVSSITVPVAHKRSGDDSSEEFTTERSHVGSKRGGDEVDGESISEVTNGDVHDKRTVEGPAAEESEETKRSVEGPTAEEPEETKRSVEGPTAEESEETKRSVEGPTAEEPEEAKRSTGEWTTEKTEMVDGKQKRTEEHTFPNEFFVTEESSTDFNNRVVRLTEHEPVALELTTIPESSSFETLAHTTGLLKQRNVSVPKLENSKGETRDTEYFRANDLSTFNQTAHEQYSSSFNDESILLLFLLAALLFCIIFVASFIAFNQMKKSLQRQSPINEMEAELDKQYDQHEN